MNEREMFLNAAVAAGCPEEQTRNLVAAQAWLQERQLVASWHQFWQHLALKFHYSRLLLGCWEWKT